MGRIVNEINGYNIIRSGHHFIVSKIADFDNHHTHNIESLKIAEGLIYCVTHNKIPNHYNDYLLNSLKRLSQDADYILKIDRHIESRKQKGKKQACFKPIKGAI